jgi:hypothetical protein
LARKAAFRGVGASVFGNLPSLSGFDMSYSHNPCQLRRPEPAVREAKEEIDKSGVALLVQIALRATERVAYEAAENALMMIRARAVAPLTSELGDPDPHVRLRATELLGKIAYLSNSQKQFSVSPVHASVDG